jgi:hypothetical protein
VCPQTDECSQKQEIQLKEKEFELKQKEYDLKLNEESAKFLESKQRLSYFLITLAVAIVGLQLDFTFKHLADSHTPKLWLYFSTISGVLSAGTSLLSLHLLHRSFRFHLLYLHAGKNWAQLNKNEQDEWDEINRWAANALNFAFIFLFVEVFFSCLFMLGALV